MCSKRKGESLAGSFIQIDKASSVPIKRGRIVHDLERRVETAQTHLTPMEIKRTETKSVRRYQGYLYYHALFPVVNHI